MNMVENKKKFYLYDRWFEIEKTSSDELIYWSIPKNAENRIKIKINLKNNEMVLSNYKNHDLSSQIEVTDIMQKNIDLHYSDIKCDLMDIGKERYDNIALEIFASIVNESVVRNYELMFTKKDKSSDFKWEEPVFPVNEKINLDNIDCQSNKVEDFTDFVYYFPVALKKLRNLINDDLEIKKENQIEEVKKEKEETKLDEVRELVIPQEMMIYDRVYSLANTTKNKIILTNTEDEIRNLEIEYDPSLLLLTGVNLKINEGKVTKSIIGFRTNDTKGITASYHSELKETVLVNHQKMEEAILDSEIVFDNDGRKIQANLSISNKDKELNLIEHPQIKNNYNDGDGNQYTVANSGFNVYHGMAAFAPGIFNNITEKIFQKVKK